MTTAASNVFHEGEIAVQKRAGVIAQGQNNGRIVSDTIIPGAIKFVSKQPFVTIGTVDERDRVWASIVVGQVGFMTAEPQALDLELSQVLRVDSDVLWNNIRSRSRVGMLVIDLRSRARLRVNGRATYVSERHLHIDVEQAYPNCPQYIQRRNYRPELTREEHVRSSSGVALTNEQQTWLRKADTLFIATQHPTSGVDASHRGGNPGFIGQVNPTRLRVPDYVGNGMFNTLGNLSVNPSAGLVIPDFERGRTLQLTGNAELLWDIEDPHNETGGTGRYWEFEIERWVQLEQSLPGSTEFLDYSSHNPTTNN